jgi:hypothetical protein
MRLWHTLAAAGLVLAAVTFAPAAPSAAKHKAHTLHGVVESVSVDKNKDHGTLVVKLHHHHRTRVAGQAAAARKPAGPTAAHRHHRHEVRVHFDRTTKFAVVAHNGKDKAVHAPAALTDVHKGEHVLVVHDGTREHHARQVRILAGHVPGHKTATGAARAHSRKKRARAL